jgi:hypothetical protein
MEAQPGIIESGLPSLTERGSDHELLDTILRPAHSIKGAAGSAKPAAGTVAPRPAAGVDAPGEVVDHVVFEPEPDQFRQGQDVFLLLRDLARTGAWDNCAARNGSPSACPPRRWTR